MGTMVDMTGVSTGFPVLPSAQYVATFTDYNIHPAGPNSKHPGTPVASLEFTVSDGGPYDGQKLFREYSLWPDVLWGIKGAGIALGGAPEDWEGAFDIEERLNDVKGNRALLTVTQREWEGEMRNNVTKIKSLDSASAVAAGGAGGAIPF